MRSSALRSRAEERRRAPFTSGRAKPRDVRMLEIADAAMHDLETFGGCTTAEVIALDQHRAQSAQRRVPERGRAERTAADDGEVVLTFRQEARISCRHPHASQSSVPGSLDASASAPEAQKL